MELRIECPECRTRFLVTPEMAGKIAECKFCERRFRVPYRSRVAVLGEEDVLPADQPVDVAPCDSAGPPPSAPEKVRPFLPLPEAASTIGIPLGACVLFYGLTLLFAVPLALDSLGAGIGFTVLLVVASIHVLAVGPLTARTLRNASVTFDFTRPQAPWPQALAICSPVLLGAVIGVSVGDWSVWPLICGITIGSVVSLLITAAALQTSLTKSVQAWAWLLVMFLSCTGGVTTAGAFLVFVILPSWQVDLPMYEASPVSSEQGGSEPRVPDTNRDEEDVRIEEYLAQAQKKHSESDYAGAIGAYDAALQIREDAAVRRKLETVAADRNRDLGQLVEQARAKANDKEYDAAVILFERAIAIDPGSVLTDELTRAKSAQRIESLLADAKQNDAGGNGPKALITLDQLLALDASHAEAFALKRKISGYSAPAKIGDTITNSIGMKLTYIPAGEFMMGSPTGETQRDADEGPQYRVRLTRPFLMQTTEVTQDQWQAVMGTTPSYFKGSDDLPVEQVSWDDAIAFCKKLSEKEGKTYLLPTEAQWEYACRAGSATPFAGSNLADMGWYLDNSGNKTHAVGQKGANAWGLYDMHGNVWEWCSDWSGAYPSGGAGDPQGAENGATRVLRGGCLNSYPRHCRSADRNWHSPDHRTNGDGFRVVCSISPSDVGARAAVQHVTAGLATNSVTSPGVAAITQKRSELPATVSQFGKAMGSLEAWTVKSGSWTVTPRGRVLGGGDSLIESKLSLDDGVRVSFRMNVVSGMRPRVHLLGTGIYIGNEGWTKTIAVYGKTSDVRGKPIPYQNGRELAVSIAIREGRFEVRVNGQTIAGKCERTSAVRLQLQGGDWYSPGQTEFWDFEVAIWK